MTDGRHASKEISIEHISHLLIGFTRSIITKLINKCGDKKGDTIQKIDI